MRMESHRGFANAVELRPLAVDDMASIRYLHTLSLKCLTGLSDDEVETLTAEIQSPEYTDRLMTGRLLTAWLGGELVGSAGWAMSARDEQAAEIGAVFVHPLFVRCGIGRRLVRAVEAEARGLGFRTFTAPVTPDAALFFERLGYRMSSRKRGQGAKRSALPLAVARRIDRAGVRRVQAPVAHA